MADLGAVAQAQGPLLGVVAVVGDLLDRLRRERRERAVAGSEFGVQQVLVGGEVQLAGDGVGEVAVGLLHELEVGEGALLAQIRQLVLVAGQGQQHAGLAEQVERDVGEGDLLLQDGGVADAFAQAVGEHQRVVAEGERGRGGHGGGHRCFTPSGIS
jgi:hypothetical protein